MAIETMFICLRALKENHKISLTHSVRGIYCSLSISQTTFWHCCLHIWTIFLKTAVNICKFGIFARERTLFNIQCISLGIFVHYTFARQHLIFHKLKMYANEEIKGCQQTTLTVYKYQSSG